MPKHSLATPVHVLLALASLVALVATLFTIDVAAAGPGTGPGSLKYPSLLKGVDASTNEVAPTTAKARCPDSHPHPTGGGVELGPATPGDFPNFLSLQAASTTVSPGRAGWEAQATNTSGSAAQMTVTAVCAKRGEYDYPSVVKNIPAGEQALKKASCPQGTQVVGGGVETGSETARVDLASSEPFDGPDPNTTPDDGWLGAANNDTTEVEPMQVTAVCARNGDYKYVRSNPLPLPDNTQSAKTARCPSGRLVTGGGVDISGLDLGLRIRDTAPSQDPNTGATGWLGTANNVATGRDETMRVFAICAKVKKGNKPPPCPQALVKSDGDKVSRVCPAPPDGPTGTGFVSLNDLCGISGEPHIPVGGNVRFFNNVGSDTPNSGMRIVSASAPPSYDSGFFGGQQSFTTPIFTEVGVETYTCTDEAAPGSQSQPFRIFVDAVG